MKRSPGVPAPGAGGGLACRTRLEVWQYVPWPLAAWIIAVGLFRGANVANLRRAGAGIPMSLAGLVLVIGTSIQALAG